MTALARRLRATGIAAGRSADVPCVRDDRERQWGGDREEVGNACHGGFELSVPRGEWASKRADGISPNPLICSGLTHRWEMDSKLFLTLRRSKADTNDR
jgi:hypothetical protein